MVDGGWRMADVIKSFLYLILFDRQRLVVLVFPFRFLLINLFTYQFVTITKDAKDIYFPFPSSLHSPQFLSPLFFISSRFVLRSVRGCRRKQNHKLEKVSIFGDFFFFSAYQFIRIFIQLCIFLFHFRKIGTNECHER